MSLVVSFYYPSRDIGGAQLLFARLAEFLQHSGYQIKIYGDETCYMVKYLTQNQVLFDLSSKKLEGRYFVETDEMFILSLSMASSIGQLFNFTPSNRFIFWDLHPNCLISQTALFEFYNKISSVPLKGKLIHILEKSRVSKIEKMVCNAVRSNGVVFMSGYNYFVNK